MEFTSWKTEHLIRLARILKLTKAVQSVEEQKELDQVLKELAKRKVFLDKDMQ